MLLNAGDLSGYQVCAAEMVRHYRYKNMKATLANIPVGNKDKGGSVSTKVNEAFKGMCVMAQRRLYSHM